VHLYSPSKFYTNGENRVRWAKAVCRNASMTAYFWEGFCWGFGCVSKASDNSRDSAMILTRFVSWTISWAISRHVLVRRTSATALCDKEKLLRDLAVLLLSVVSKNRFNRWTHTLFA
jgi:hypothetical protein